RETGGHQERELADAGRAVTRNDVGVAPLHHSRSEGMPELDRVDQEAAGPALFGLGREEAKSRHEAAVGHRGRRVEPLELQDVLLVDEHSPGVSHQLVHAVKLRQSDAGYKYKKLRIRLYNRTRRPVKKTY